MTHRQLYDILVNDLLAILRTLRDDMGIKECILLAWSQGNNIAQGLFTPEHLSATTNLLPFLQAVILWEPSIIALGFPPSPTAQKYLNMERFLDYVGGFYMYPEEYLAKHIPCKTNDVFETDKSTVDDPEYVAWSEKAQDTRSLTPNLFAKLDNDPSKVAEKAREAYHGLARFDVKKAVIYGNRTCPECIEGCWISRDWIQEGGGDCQVFIIDDANHFVQLHEPEKLWECMMAV